MGANERGDDTSTHSAVEWVCGRRERGRASRTDNIELGRAVDDDWGRMPDLIFTSWNTSAPTVTTRRVLLEIACDKDIPREWLMDEWTKVPERLCGAALRPAGPCWRGPTAIFILSSTFRRIVQKNQYVPLIPKSVAGSIEGGFFSSLARNSAVGAEAAKGFPLSPPWCGSPWMRKKVIMDPQSAKKKNSADMDPQETHYAQGSPGDPLQWVGGIKKTEI